MVYTSPTSINASQGWGVFMNYLNEITNYWFSNGLLLTIWFIVLGGYLYAKQDDYLGALAVASYCTFLFALLLFIGGWLPAYSLGISIALMIIFTAFLWLVKREQATA